MRSLVLIAMTLLGGISSLANAYTMAEDGCAEVIYDGKEYCLKYDEGLAAQISQRVLLMGLANRTHLLVTAVSDALVAKRKCLEGPPTTREALLTCLNRLAEGRGTLVEAKRQVVRLKDQTLSTDAPQKFKDRLARQQVLIEKSFESSLDAFDAALDKANQRASKMLVEELSSEVQAARTNGSNTAFCGLLKGMVRLQDSAAPHLFRAASVGDTFGIRDIQSQLLATSVRAKIGYPLCGFPKDDLFLRNEKAASEAVRTANSQDVRANLKKACASLSVQKWPGLAQACKTTKKPSDELLASLHAALTDVYRETE